MIFEDALRLALEEYDNAIMDALPAPSACDHRFSKRFERKMHGVCRTAKHPAAYKTLLRVACILLAMLALLGGVFAVGGTVKAGLRKWQVERYRGYYRYFIPMEYHSEQLDNTQYTLCKIPDGYQLTQEQSVPYSHAYLYANAEGKKFMFDYTSIGEVYIGEDDRECITIHNACTGTHAADLYMDSNPENNSTILWIDNNTGKLFTITGPFRADELIEMAESVIVKN